LRLIAHTRALAAAVCLVATAAAVLHGADTGLRITPTVSNDRLLVTFELEGADVTAVHEAIASGLRTTFTYELELRTIVPGWIDRTIATTVVTMSDQYDNLTRRHTLSRSVDGRIEEVTVTDDEGMVRSWLTKLTRVPVYNTSRLDPSRDYYVRITSRARPFGGSLLGLTRTITARAKFTVVP
jgi:Domain of unknown function (DUF4390)